MESFQNVGALLAYVLTILLLFDRVPMLRRFYLNSMHSLNEARKTFSERRYWRRHRPICRIVKAWPLRIIKTPGYDYVLEMELTIEFQSKGDYTTNIDTPSHNILVQVPRKGRTHAWVKGGPYKLYRQGQHEFTLPSRERIVRPYILRGTAYGRKPSIQIKPECVFIVEGVQLQHNTSQTKPRTIKSNSFTVNTEWEDGS